MRVKISRRPAIMETASTIFTWPGKCAKLSVGPMSPAQLQQAVSTGRVTDTSMVWSAGMGAWQPAGQVPQLAAAFGPPPPPPPPAPPPP